MKKIDHIQQIKKNYHMSKEDEFALYNKILIVKSGIANILPLVIYRDFLVEMEKDLQLGYIMGIEIDTLNEIINSDWKAYTKPTIKLVRKNGSNTRKRRLH